MMRKITPHRIPRTGSATRMRGFTLIELMIGITIGLIVLLGLTVFFSSNSRNQHDLERSIVRMENSRFALDTLTEDLLHAGYYAQHVPASGTAYQTIVTCPTDASKLGWSGDATQMPPAVQGFIADEDDVTQDCLTDHRVPGTGAITVTRAETGNPVPLAETEKLVALARYIQTTSCATDAKRVIIDTVPVDAELPDLEVLFPLKTRACEETPPIDQKKDVHRLSQRTYFLSECNNCTSNDGIPSLKRSELVGNSFVINTVAEGVERLQFEYGVDTNGDGQLDEVWLRLADSWGVDTDNDGDVDKALPFEALTGSDWSNVVAVRIHMLTRSSLPDPGHVEQRTFQMGPLTLEPADLPAGFKRTLLTTTVPLTNVAGRRE